MTCTSLLSADMLGELHRNSSSVIYIRQSFDLDSDRNEEIFLGTACYNEGFFGGGGIAFFCNICSYL